MPNIRYGLCCLFVKEDILFKTATASSIKNLSRKMQLETLSLRCEHNLISLKKALSYCANNQIGSFRITSTLFPLQTHPEIGYRLEELPNFPKLRVLASACKQFAYDNHLRTSFHPDQFVVLNSPREEVVINSIAEIEAHARMAQLLGSDTINIHAGGAYGDKEGALTRFCENFEKLSGTSKNLLTIENDDTSYTPEDLLPVCFSQNIPLVYDIHHHRCNPDSLSIEEASEYARLTWEDREPVFHISSPKEGYGGKNPKRHHDFINPIDFPKFWSQLNITLEVEAKAKELAIKQLLQQKAVLQ